jgi:general secretion pathway protein A
MYTSHFGLREKPFSLTPDPRFLFLSSSHREALAHVLYGVEQGEGFMAVTGEVGTGKTTLCRTLLERLGAETEVAFLFDPLLTPDELLRAVCAEFGLRISERSRAELSDALNRFLLDAHRDGRRVLLIVDEAQNLPVETLEQIRLLSNLETSTAKLIQIILFGQPELDEMLERPELRQLRQRITVRWRLDALARGEARDYVRHRIRVAAGGERELFTQSALREIDRRAHGIPRLVNLLADRALLAGYAEGASLVDRPQVDRAAREILRARSARRPMWWRVANGAPHSERGEDRA